MLDNDMKPFLEQDKDSIICVINTNITATTLFCHGLLADMKKKGKGGIINICSLTMKSPDSPLVHNSTQYYMACLSTGLSSAMAGKGVTVQTVYPGTCSPHQTWHGLHPTQEQFVASALPSLGQVATITAEWPDSVWLMLHRVVGGWLGDCVVGRGLGEEVEKEG